VLNGGVSASWMNDERLLANGVSTTKRGETIVGRNCFINDVGEKNDGVEGDEKC
jgi:hypothetical protein